MEREDTRHGPNEDGMKYVEGMGFKVLRSLTARVTVSCQHHGSHEALVAGPYQWVLDLLGTFREFCAEQDRWSVIEYSPTDQVLERHIGDWE